MKKRLTYLWGTLLLSLTLAGCGGGNSGNGGNTVQYTLSIEIAPEQSAGSVDPGGGTAYDAGTVVTLTPSPAAHWVFLEWDGPDAEDVKREGEGGPWQITMNGDKSLIARFIQITRTLTIEIIGEGSVDQELKVKSGDRYVEGDIVTLTARPEPGWKFDRWEGDLTGTVNPQDITMDVDKTVRAVFSMCWQPVGGAGFSAGSALDTSLALDSSGRPYVVYSDGSNGQKATVMRYNGAGWEIVGSAGFSGGIAVDTCLALDYLGVPYVAYRDGGALNKATVMRFDNTSASWVYVGDRGFSAGDVNTISLALDAGDRPCVAYRDGGNGYKATMMGFNGTVWMNVGGAGFSAGEAASTSLKFDSMGAPYVAYRDYANGDKATVMKPGGTGWTPVGGAGFSAGLVRYISLAFDNNDTPYVAYRDAGNGDKATVMKFTGTSWEIVGSAGFSAGEVERVSLAIDSSGTPYVAYLDGANGNKVTVMRFNGVSWETVGGAGFSAGEAKYTRLAIHADGTLYVAYQDMGNDGKATVMKYEP